MAPACRPARWRSVSCRAGRVASRRRPCLVFTPHGGRSRHAGDAQSPAPPEGIKEVYPANVRKWIARHGVLSGRLILLKGRELAAMVPVCDAGPATRTHPPTRTIGEGLLA